MIIVRNARFVVASVALFVSAASAAAQTKEPYPGLEAYIAKARETWKIPGLAWFDRRWFDLVDSG